MGNSHLFIQKQLIEEAKKKNLAHPTLDEQIDLTEKALRAIGGVEALKSPNPEIKQQAKDLFFQLKNLLTLDEQIDLTRQALRAIGGVEALKSPEPEIKQQAKDLFSQLKTLLTNKRVEIRLKIDDLENKLKSNPSLTINFTVNYFVAGPWNPFGHASLSDFCLEDGTKLNISEDGVYEDNKSVYFSYVHVGNDKEYTSTSSNFEAERAHYAGEDNAKEKKEEKTQKNKKSNDDNCIRFQIHNMEARKVISAMEKFRDADLTKYNVLEENCSTNVNAFLTSLAITQPSIHDIRPAYVAGKVCNSLIKNVAAKHNEILNSNQDPVTKIKNLLKSDVKLLELKTAADRISHLDYFKNLKEKHEKIALLKTALAIVSDDEYLELNGNFAGQFHLEKTLKKLLEIDEKLLAMPGKNETRNNFLHVLAEFQNILKPYKQKLSKDRPQSYPNEKLIKELDNAPKKKISSDYVKTILKNVNSESALLEKELEHLPQRRVHEAYDLIKKLIEVIIEKSKLEIQLADLSILGSFKNKNSLHAEQEKLKELFGVLNKQPIDLQQSLDALEKTSKELKSEQLKLCVNKFPKDLIASQEFDSVQNTNRSVNSIAETYVGTPTENSQANYKPRSDSDSDVSPYESDEDSTPKIEEVPASTFTKGRGRS